MSTSNLSSRNSRFSDEQIAERAYYVYLNRMENNIPGDSDTDWIQAEALLTAELTEKKEKKEKKRKPQPRAAAKTRTLNQENLGQIKGIGPTFIKRLRAEGITKVSQIAAMTRKDVEELEEKLKCKGRITREKWIEQAKKIR